MISVYISGICGFVGSNFVRHLLQAGYYVGGCDSMEFGYAENLPQGFVWTRKGIDCVLSEINQYDILVSCHTANIIYAQDHPIGTHHTNTIDTINLFREFEGKIIYTSTSSVYGNADELPTTEDAPKKLTNAYARSKYCAELFLQDRGNYTTVRLSNVFGRNQRPDHAYSGVIGKVLGAMLNTGEIKVYGNGEQTRDFVYVDDVCDAIIKAIELPALNTEINIGTGIETSVNQLIEIGKELCGDGFLAYNVEPRVIDNVDRRCLDNTKAQRLLGWSPKTKIKDGMRLTAAWLSSIR